MKRKVLVIAAILAMVLMVLGTVARGPLQVLIDGGTRPACTNTNKFKSIEWNSNATYKYDCQCDQGGKGTGLQECD